MTSPAGFSLNQILAEIENIYKFKELVPLEPVSSQSHSALKLP